MTCTCIDCGKEFEISEGEAKFFKSKGLSLPKRCKSCREKKKQTGGAADKGAAKKTPSGDGGHPTGERGKKKNSRIGAIIAAVVAVVAAAAGGGALLGNHGPAQPPEATAQADLEDERDTASGSAQQGEDSEAPDDAQTDMFADEEYTSGRTYSDETVVYTEYTFANDRLLREHYDKHGKEMGFDSPEEYEDAASDVVNNPDALHKTEAEDGDDVYYVTATNEFVVVSSYGYIRTYFNPSDGIDYFNRQ